MASEEPMIETEIGSRDPELQIRGYSIYDLCENASLQDLNALMFYGDLSSPERDADLQIRVQ